jgi:hypothetical protein
MTRFSQRIGARPPFKSGLEEASQGLRVAVWNGLHNILVPVASERALTARARAKELWRHLGWPTDEVPHSVYDIRNHLKTYWFECAWEDFFDLVEFGVQMIAPEFDDHSRAGWFDLNNDLLEGQGCAYRFIAEELAPVTNPNPTEMASVGSAADCSIDSVGKHIRAALSQLPPAPSPSPRNSVKESISAVEAALKHLTGEPTATLGEALKLFETKYGPLHASIRRGSNFTHTPTAPTEFAMLLSMTLPTSLSTTRDSWSWHVQLSRTIWSPSLPNNAIVKK